LKIKSVIKELKNSRPINCAAFHKKKSIMLGDEGRSPANWDLYKDNNHKITLES